MKGLGNTFDRVQDDLYRSIANKTEAEASFLVYQYGYSQLTHLLELRNGLLDKIELIEDWIGQKDWK